MQIQILNADERALSDIKNILSAYPKVKIKVKEQKSKKTSLKDSKEQKLTINGYTEEFEKEILEDMKEIDRQRENGTLKVYNNIKDLRKALLS